MSKRKTSMSSAIGLAISDGVFFVAAVSFVLMIATQLLQTGRPSESTPDPVAIENRYINQEETQPLVEVSLPVIMLAKPSAVHPVLKRSKTSRLN